MKHTADKFILIAGPCAAESLEICREAASSLQQLQVEHPELSIIFKSSFDKANRTSIQSPRGPGLDQGLEILNTIKAEFGFPVLTDFHTPEQAGPVGEVCDVLQIPAFLCRQTDLLVAAAETGKVVNVKKGQFLAPQDMTHVVSKLEEAGAAEIWLTERGTTFGYQNLVVDMRSFPILGQFNHPVIFDATHSVQLPGAGAGQSSGDRQFIPPLARAATAAGIQGLFVETHPNPGQAICDASNQVALNDLPKLVKECLEIWKLAQSAINA